MAGCEKPLLQIKVGGAGDGTNGCVGLLMTDLALGMVAIDASAPPVFVGRHVEHGVPPMTPQGERFLQQLYFRYPAVGGKFVFKGV